MAHMKIHISKISQSWRIGDFYMWEMAMLLIAEHEKDQRLYGLKLN